jgi:hypothetical protein
VLHVWICEGHKLAVKLHHKPKGLYCPATFDGVVMHTGLNDLSCCKNTHSFKLLKPLSSVVGFTSGQHRSVYRGEGGGACRRC